MRSVRLLPLALTALLVAGCTVPVGSPDPSRTPVSSSAPLPGVDPGSGASAQVTVPGLGGSPTSGAAPTSAVSPVVTTAVVESPGEQPPVRTGQTGPAPASCAGCTVLGTRKAVNGDYSAALVSLQGDRAALLSLTADGVVGAVANVPYGNAFAPPAGGLLDCDTGGRCLVIGRTAEGKAIGSAFALAADGSWTDVSMDGGFVSATEKAAVVDLDGEPGIAIQAAGDGKVVWAVYVWAGAEDGYQPAGCAPDGPLDPAALRSDACLS